MNEEFRMSLSERFTIVLLLAIIVTLLAVTGCNRGDAHGRSLVPTIDDCSPSDGLPVPPPGQVWCLDASGLSAPRLFNEAITLSPTACSKFICYVDGQCYFRCPPRRCP
jgi:hypothetical protein